MKLHEERKPEPHPERDVQVVLFLPTRRTQYWSELSPTSPTAHKPVQRRILCYTTSRMEDRLTKVNNIVGNTMMFHPHGDRYRDALVQLGQKSS